MTSHNGASSPNPDPLGIKLQVRTDLRQSPLQDVIRNWDTVLRGQLSLVGLLPGGMASGRASVGLVIDLGDGRQVIAETSWRALRAAARALNACPLGEAEARMDGWT